LIVALVQKMKRQNHTTLVCVLGARVVDRVDLNAMRTRDAKRTAWPSARVSSSSTRRAVTTE